MDQPDVLDRVTNEYLPIDTPRETSQFASLLAPKLPSLIDGEPALAEAAIRLAAKYKVDQLADRVAAVAESESVKVPVRIAALEAVVSLRGEGALDTVRRAVDSDSPRIRSSARRLLIDLDPQAAVKQLELALREGTTSERQQAIAGLTDLATDRADAILVDWFDRFLAGDVPSAIQLDLIEAAESRNTPEFQSRLTEYRQGLTEGDPLADYRVCLEGGDADAGYAIFSGRSDASCRRCHSVEPGTILVGPNLAGIGADKNRQYLLESLVLPDKTIAKGFETVVAITAEGKTVAGVKRSEDDEKLVLVMPTGEEVTLLRDNIEFVAPGKSGMPADLIKHLSRGDVRDIVEFLSSLKDKNKTFQPGGGHE